MRYGFGQYLLVSPAPDLQPCTCSDAELLRAISTPTPSPRRRRRSLDLWGLPKLLDPLKPRRAYISASAPLPAAQGAVRSWADEHLLRVWSEVTSGQAALLGRGTFGCVFRCDLPNETPTRCAVKLYIALGVTIDNALHEFDALRAIGYAERGSRAARARALDPTSRLSRLARCADARRPADQRARCARRG